MGLRIQRMDPVKAAWRLALYTIHRLVADEATMIREVRESKHVDAHTLLDVALDMAGRVDPVPQRDAFRITAVFFLWVYAKDAAYRDQGRWALAEAHRRLAPVLEHVRVLEPGEWHINQWYRQRTPTPS